ncbi:MAG: ATP-binding protein, partial [Bacteroidetes bacterium]|nr:ATP-binding protein [Bacteroidota bacterium]
SIKFAKENESPVIKIYSKTVQNKINPEKQMVELYFEDNGIGFDEKFNDRIYNIFQKLEGNKYRGSGIGLSICKKIVERHNGTIYAKSIKDKGTTFVVTLPIKQDNSNE